MCISFIVGFSKNRLYGILGYKNSIKADLFLKYIQWLVKDFKSDSNLSNTNLLIVVDNASIRK